MAKKKTNDDSRPTASDYLQQMRDLQNQTTKLDLVVTTRLYTLCASYPNAIIKIGNTDVKASILIPESRSKAIINEMPYEERIQYIQAIEQWLADRQKHVQTRMY